MARGYDRSDDAPRIYRYVLMYDGGMAPNPRDGLVTLATCKPQIRATARKGDWVIGNFPSPNNDVVAWAGKVGEVRGIVEYAEQYPERDDALHEYSKTRRIRRIEGKHTWYHPGADEQRKDKCGHVLVFERKHSWYCGENGRQIPPAIGHLIVHGQGHRLTSRQDGDLEALIRWLKEQGPPGIHGEPRGGWAGPDESDRSGWGLRGQTGNKAKRATGC